MSGAKRREAQQDREAGTAAALRTIYKPELAAQARFDALLEQLKSEPFEREGKNNGVA